MIEARVLHSIAKYEDRPYEVPETTYQLYEEYYADQDLIPVIKVCGTFYVLHMIEQVTPIIAVVDEPFVYHHFTIKMRGVVENKVLKTGIGDPDVTDPRAEVEVLRIRNAVLAILEGHTVVELHPEVSYHQYTRQYICGNSKWPLNVVIFG